MAHTDAAGRRHDLKGVSGPFLCVRRGLRDNAHGERVKVADDGRQTGEEAEPAAQGDQAALR